MRLFTIAGTMLLLGGAISAEKPSLKNDASSRAVFTADDERLIHEYYGRRPFRLPPGIEEKISRTGKLPAGSRRKIGPLPADLVHRLSTLQCVGCERGVIEGCAVIFNPETEAVFAAIPIFAP